MGFGIADFGAAGLGTSTGFGESVSGAAGLGTATGFGAAGTAGGVTRAAACAGLG